MAPQSPISLFDEVEYQHVEHAREVYWDVSAEDLTYLGIFQEGLNPIGCLQEPEELWLPLTMEFDHIIPDWEEPENWQLPYLINPSDEQDRITH